MTMSSRTPSAPRPNPVNTSTLSPEGVDRRLDVGAIQIAAQTFGHPDHDAVVLVMGATASMLWWPTELCDAIARAGFYVTRYDHRDTGQSTTGDPGDVNYSAEDLTADLIGLLDALDIDAAHLVGMSLGGYISQIAALSHPDRVRSLTLIGSEPLGTTEELPAIEEKFMTHFGAMSELDWSDDDAVEGFLVGIGRLSAGTPERFDEVGTRDRVRAEIARAVNISSAFNHAMVTTTDDWTDAVEQITKPTLVIHGEHDPILPLPNGQAIAEHIGGAQICVLDDAGHELNPRDLPTIADTIITFLTQGTPNVMA